MYQVFGKQGCTITVQNKLPYKRLGTCIGFRATQIKNESGDNAQVIREGNKCDLEDDRLIPTEDSQRLADELGEKERTPCQIHKQQTEHAYIYALELM